MRAFSPRPIRALGLLRHGGWRLRTYSIVTKPLANPLHSFHSGILRALRELPTPAVTAKRIGVGCLILHHARGADYVVLAWWDNENELPMRVLVRPQEPRARWRAAKPHESVCVWDLEVIWAERNAYVETVLVLAGRNPGERYATSASPFLPRGSWRELRL